MIELKIKIHAYKYSSDKPAKYEFPMHTHSDYEILCFLSGNADYFVEGNRYKLMPGDIIILRKHESHHVILKTNLPYERIVVNFDLAHNTEFESLLAPFNNRAAGEKNLYRSSVIKDSNMIYYLKKLANAQNKVSKICWLLPFLEELKNVFLSGKINEKPTRDKATDIINYINTHLTEDISLSLISEEFFISQNHINRLFKEYTRTTLWDYVTLNRLMLAQKKLSLGKKPTEIYRDCGFNDYSTFFRAYRKHFGHSPKSAKKAKDL